ncbi:MAG TPA: HIT family protein [Methanoregulaceae archaeon]|nr:MAG: HIT family protein [Methanolinea sp.]HON82415.1 HIT family protein [Methanoregulaceae archaeon]HPD11318.1 HIT family protein [Methanoregulaceae archaeon]HRT16190.1 HIT family protein [Methanoregulaceae archaeon]HRU31753.1 HIT family protein [Methanoregulaceae archaeon]
MDCVLCKVAKGELPSWKIYEDEYCIGVLDVAPCAPGHCLVVPKKHVEKFYDLPDDDLATLFIAAKTIARKIKAAYSPDHVCMFIRGGRLPHLHVALFPSTEGDGVSGFPQSNYPKHVVDLEASADLLRRV